MNIFQELDERILKTLQTLGITVPSEIQEKGIPAVLSGKNVLLIAPTGTGKTEAGLLPVLHKILKNGEEPIACIYVTPLRALNRDMLKRTQIICENAGLKVNVRHGDTSQYERTKQAEHPAHLLITTPETLQILFLGAKLRKALINVRHVIIDEIHEMCSSERGYQLSIALERLERFCGHQIQRIGLSATVGEPKKVSRFLVGTNRDCEIVDCGMEKNLSISVSMPEITSDEKDLQIENLSPESASAMRYIANTIKSSSGTLVFVNTRSTAEFLGVHMQHLFPELKLGVHHGSLSKDVRIECEEEFKSGEKKAIIATSSLELGIDIGHVEKVIQYNSPRQAGRLLQRVGRSGHGIGRISTGLIICEDALDAIEAGVLAKMALAGKIEEVRIRENSLSALANQIIGMTLSEGWFDAEEFYAMVKNAYPFRNLEHEKYMEVIQALATLRKIFLVEHRVESTRSGREYFYENISMIPDERTYRVIDLSARKTIATLDEAFVVQNLEIGKEFAVKGCVWVVEEIHEDEVYVLPSQRIAMPPSWSGEEIPVSFECAMEVGKILRTRVLDIPVDEHARIQIMELLKLTCLPTDREVHVCHQGKTCMVLATFGSRVNETLARALSILLSAKLGESVGFTAEPYCFLLEFPKLVSIEEIRGIIEHLANNAHGLQSVIEKGVGSVSYFKWTFVNVAKKFGLIKRDADYSQINIERFMELQKETCIFREAVNRTVFEHMDIENTQCVLRRIASGEIKVNYQNRFEGFAERAFARASGFASADVVTLQLINSVRERLLDTEMALICMSCGTVLTYRLRSISRFYCIKCNSVMIAGMRRAERSIIESCKKYFEAKKDANRLSKGEKKNLEKAWLCANLVRSKGRDAMLALAGRGIGPETAARILAIDYANEDELIREIIKAEIKYAQTKKFWK
ncbi:MAG: DEAD/DEAH box helicase [Thermoplasmata archaeon]